MKKILLFTFISYISVLGLFAQSIELSNVYGKVNNGDSIVLVDTNATASFVVGIDVKNISSSSLDIRVKKTELIIISGSENYFCWVSCYLPGTYVSPDGITVSSGASSAAFTGDYLSHGNAGASYIMYTFFDYNNPNDSIAFIAKYVAGSGVGINNPTPKVEVSNLYPNPAKNTVSINYNLNGAQNGQLEIYNILGSVVKIIKINETNGRLSIDVSDLNNGVYFYSFIADDRIITSKRLVIQR